VEPHHRHQPSAKPCQISSDIRKSAGPRPEKRALPYAYSHGARRKLPSTRAKSADLLYASPKKPTRPVQPPISIRLSSSTTAAPTRRYYEERHQTGLERSSSHPNSSFRVAQGVNKRGIPSLTDSNRPHAVLTSSGPPCRMRSFTSSRRAGRCRIPGVSAHRQYASRFPLPPSFPRPSLQC